MRRRLVLRAWRSIARPTLTIADLSLPQDAAPTGSDRPLCAKWFRQTKSGGTTDRPKPKCHASGMLTVEVPTAEAAHVAATKAAHVAAAKAAHVATTEAAEVVATKAVRVAEVSSG